MALFNYATREITLKIVYYGPGLSGKTTNLQYLHQVLNPETKGKLLSLATESDRTLFFDFLPVELGKIRDFSIRFQLYTVPGQVRYNATRKVVLKGADAVIFVADSQQEMRDQNVESLENMRDNLVANNISPDGIPVVLQYNKRDLKNVLTVGELSRDLNPDGLYEVLEATAVNGGGVEETFKRITKLVLKDISKKHKIEIQPADAKKESSPEPRVKPAAPAERSVKPPLPEPPVITVKAASPSSEEVFEIDVLEFAEEESSTLPEQIAEVYAEHSPEPSASRKPVPVFTSPSPVPPSRPTEEPSPAEQIAPVDDWEEQIRASQLPDKPVVAQARAEISQQPLREEMPPSPGAAVPDEQRQEVRDALALIRQEMGGITNAVALLQESLSEMKREIEELRKSQVALSEKQGVKSDAPDVRDSREFRELRHEQKEILDLARYISDAIGSLKEKKSWFRF